MLSQRALVAASRIISHGCFFHFLPFSWEPKTFTLKPLPKSRRILALLLLVNQFFHTIYLTLSYFHLGNRGGGYFSSATKIQLFLWISVFAFACVLSANNFVKLDDAVVLINQFFKVHGTLQCKYGETNVSTKPKTTGSERILRIFLVISYIHSAARTKAFTKDPSNPRYYSSHFPPDMSATIRHWGLRALTIYEFLGYLYNWLIITFLGTILICYWHGISYWLKEMRFHRQGGNSPKNRIHHITTLSIYRQFQVLNTYFEEYCRNTVLPALQICVISIPVVCNHILVRFHQSVGIAAVVALPFVSFACTNFILVAFPLGAAVNGGSAAFIRTRKLGCRDNYEKRIIKSMPVIKTNLGRFMLLQKFTTFKFFGQIVYWTMRSLLLFRGQPKDPELG